MSSEVSSNHYLSLNDNSFVEVQVVIRWNKNFRERGEGDPNRGVVVAYILTTPVQVLSEIRDEGFHEGQENP